MLSVANAFFYRVNRQPARDVERLLSLPVSVIAVQDSIHVYDLLVETAGTAFQARSFDKDSVILFDNSIEIKRTEGVNLCTGERVSALVNYIDQGGKEYCTVLVNIDEDNFIQDSRTLNKAYKECYDNLKSLLKRLGKENENLLVFGSFDLYQQEGKKGLFGFRKRPDKMFKSVGLNFFTSHSDILAWSDGIKADATNKTSSEQTGSTHDWLVVDFS